MGEKVNFKTVIAIGFIFLFLFFVILYFALHTSSPEVVLRGSLPPGLILLGLVLIGLKAFKTNTKTIVACLIIVLLVLSVQFVLSERAPGMSSKCESFKSQISGLCAAKPTDQLCQELGDIDNNPTTPDGSGKECEWGDSYPGDTADKRCTVKQGIDWIKFYPDQCG